MSAKKYVNLFDQKTIDIVTAWSNTKNSKVKESAKYTASVLEKLSEDIEYFSFPAGFIDGCPAEDVKVRLDKTGNELDITYANNNSSTCVYISEEKYKLDLNHTPAIRRTLNGKMCKALSLIPDYYSFYKLFIRFMAMDLHSEKEYSLIKVYTVSDDYYIDGYNYNECSFVLTFYSTMKCKEIKIEFTYTKIIN